MNKKPRISKKQLLDRFLWLYTKTGSSRMQKDIATAHELCNAYKLVFRDNDIDWREAL